MVEESWSRGKRHTETFRTHHTRPQSLSDAEILAVERLTSVLEGERMRQGTTPNADTRIADRTKAREYIRNYHSDSLDRYTLPPQIRYVLERTL